MQRGYSNTVLSGIVSSSSSSFVRCFALASCLGTSFVTRSTNWSRRATSSSAPETDSNVGSQHVAGFELGGRVAANVARVVTLSSYSTAGSVCDGDALERKEMECFDSTLKTEEQNTTWIDHYRDDASRSRKEKNLNMVSNTIRRTNYRRTLSCTSHMLRIALRYRLDSNRIEPRTDVSRVSKQCKQKRREVCLAGNNNAATYY